MLGFFFFIFGFLNMFSFMMVVEIFNFGFEWFRVLFGGGSVVFLFLFFVMFKYKLVDYCYG